MVRNGMRVIRKGGWNMDLGGGKIIESGLIEIKGSIIKLQTEKRQ